MVKEAATGAGHPTTVPRRLHLPHGSGRVSQLPQPPHHACRLARQQPPCHVRLPVGCGAPYTNGHCPGPRRRPRQRRPRRPRPARHGAHRQPAPVGCRPPRRAALPPRRRDGWPAATPAPLLSARGGGARAGGASGAANQSTRSLLAVPRRHRVGRGRPRNGAAVQAVVRRVGRPHQRRQHRRRHGSQERRDDSAKALTRHHQGWVGSGPATVAVSTRGVLHVAFRYTLILASTTHPVAYLYSRQMKVGHSLLTFSVSCEYTHE